MPRAVRFVLSVFTAMVLVACGGGGGDTDGGTDPGMDGGGGTGCDGVEDGMACGSGLICVGGECVEAGCGDGFLDEEAGEQCDDGNDEAFDGCEPGTCTFTCEDASACDDGNPCNGAESCGAEHVCESGTPPGDGTACTRMGGSDGVCRGADCVAAGCGNGVMDAGEECDDGNEMDRDGCDVDCTYSCLEDIDCADADTCNGDESCDEATHACVAGEALDCDDGNACTEDLCDPINGCENPLMDADMDGHAPDSIGECGDDCDDSEPSVFEGGEELCDGLDNDCNDIVDDGAPTWYIDCDGDGFAADTTGATAPSCDAPSSPPAGCSGGAWTSVRPVGASSTDCNDANDDVFPGQTAYFPTAIPGTSGDFDYNCDGSHSRRYGCLPRDSTCGPRCGDGYLERSDSNPNGCTFLCIVGGGCYVSSRPDCGESAQYRNCSGTGGSFCLIGIAGNQQQACR